MNLAINSNIENLHVYEIDVKIHFNVYNRIAGTPLYFQASHLYTHDFSNGNVDNTVTVKKMYTHFAEKYVKQIVDKKSSLLHRLPYGSLHVLLECNFSFTRFGQKSYGVFCVCVCGE